MASHNRSISMEIPKFVNFVLERLRHKGLLAFIVGGAVRDALLGRPQEDWDIATSGSPSQIQDIFSDTRQFQLKHETVTLIIDTHKVEVTTFRGKYAYSLQEDLSRRDFTIDAMAFDPAEKRLIDPFGGQEDLAKRRIKAVVNPEDRFNEDPVRLLRAVRLATELGFGVDLETLTAEALKGVWRGARLECATTQKMRAGFFDGGGDGHQLVFAFNRTRSGNDGHLVAANEVPVNIDDGVFGVKISIGKFEGTADGHYALYPGQTH